MRQVSIQKLKVNDHIRCIDGAKCYHIVTKVNHRGVYDIIEMIYDIESNTSVYLFDTKLEKLFYGKANS